jgi:DNA-binding winged helix-turn-helix (wHTH) protein/RecA/RadA recombinase
MQYRWEQFELDPDARRLTGPDGEIHTEPQVFDVLVFLVEQRAKVVAKTEILDVVWGDQFVSESALATRIKQVRQALGDDGRTQKFVRNVHGRGYQFVGELIGQPTEHSTAAAPSVEVATVSPLDVAMDIAVDVEFPFVGRTQELQDIAAVVQGPVNDPGVSNGRAFIGGAPGSGKSRLAVEVLAQAAASGATVCAGRCEANVTSGLQAVRDAFAQLAANNPTRLAQWSHGLEGQLVSLIPSLARHLPNDPVPVDAYGGIDVFIAVFERIVAEGALVVLVDDLQWSDEPTRALLSRLHRRLRGLPVSTLATFRSGRAELPDDVDQWINEECRTANSLRLGLGDLDGDAAADLVLAVTGEQVGPDGEQLIAATGGHSLFLTESLRDREAGHGTAGSVNELIGRRLARQANEVQQIIAAGAALGPEFPFAVAASAADLPPDEALAAIDTAIEAELLHETASPSRFRFSHQLVPQAILSELSRSALASLHAACAEALRNSGADEVEVAFHTLGAIPLVDMDEAVRHSRDVAERATRANQYDRAHRLLEAALDVEPQARTRAEITLDIGRIINRKGMPALALNHLTHVADTARQNGWPDLFVDAALAHWNQSPFRSPSDSSTLELLAEADDLLSDGSPNKKALIIAKTAVFNVFRKPMQVRAAALDEAMSLVDAETMTDMERLRLLEWQHITFLCPAGIAELDRIEPEIERLRRTVGTYFTDAAAPETVPFILGRGDDLRRVSRSDNDRVKAQPIAEWRDHALRSTIAFFDGDIEQARELCDRAGEIGEAYWGESSFALHGFGQFLSDMLSGEWTQSKDLLEALDLFSGSPIFRGAFAAATHAAGDEDAAATLVDGIDFDRLHSYGEHILGGNGLVGCAEAALRLDHDALATATEAALAPFENLMLGVPWSSSLAAADPLARLAQRRGDDAAADRYRELARSVYEGLDAPGLVALRLQ